MGYMTNVESEITTRFMEIQEADKLNFVIDPFTAATTEDVSHISSTAEEELIDIRNNFVAKRSARKRIYKLLA